MFKNILVALDHSPISVNVYDEAIALAKANHAGLMLMHVLSPVDEGYPLPIYPGPDSIYPTLHEEALKAYDHQWQEFQHQGLEELRTLAKQAIAAGVAAEFTQNVGDPGRVICEIARNWNADLIVMGRRGRSGLSELILGSVSNYVLHHASCSVLTIQGRGTSQPQTTDQKQAAEAR